MSWPAIAGTGALTIAMVAAVVVVGPWMGPFVALAGVPLGLCLGGITNRADAMAGRVHVTDARVVVPGLWRTISWPVEQVGEIRVVTPDTALGPRILLVRTDGRVVARRLSGKFLEDQARVTELRQTGVTVTVVGTKEAPASADQVEAALPGSLVLVERHPDLLVWPIVLGVVGLVATLFATSDEAGLTSGSATAADIVGYVHLFGLFACALAYVVGVLPAPRVPLAFSVYLHRAVWWKVAAALVGVAVLGVVRASLDGPAPLAVLASLAAGACAAVTVRWPTDPRAAAHERGRVRHRGRRTLALLASIVLSFVSLV
jgi:hypothetical protein